MQQDNRWHLVFAVSIKEGILHGLIWQASRAVKVVMTLALRKTPKSKETSERKLALLRCLPATHAGQKPKVEMFSHSTSHCNLLRHRTLQSLSLATKSLSADDTDPLYMHSDILNMSIQPRQLGKLMQID